MEEKNNKKYLKWILIGVFAVLVVMSFFVGRQENSKEDDNKMSEDASVIIANAQEESNNVKEEETKELSEINMDTYLEYYNGEENKIILIARPTCQYCQIAEPIIKNIAYENDLEINYLNTDNFSGDDEANLVKSNEFFSQGFGTPLLLVVSKGEIVNKVDGLTDKAHYTEFFKTSGFIN